MGELRACYCGARNKALGALSVYLVASSPATAEVRCGVNQPARRADPFNKLFGAVMLRCSVVGMWVRYPGIDARVTVVVKESPPEPLG